MSSAGHACCTDSFNAFFDLEIIFSVLLLYISSLLFSVQRMLSIEVNNQILPMASIALWGPVDPLTVKEN